MKKNIFYTLAAVVTFLTFSCSKDTEVQTPDKPVPVDPIVPTEKSVVLSGAVDATKVSSDNNGAYKWQASDIITILTDNGNNREFTAEEAGISTDFSGHIPDADELEGGFALYPASGNHSISGTTITFNMPNELAWGADASYMPMYAPITIVEQKPSASFKAVGGALKLILYNIPSGAAYLAFTAASVNIAGDFSLDTTAETPVISGGESKEIDINFSDNYSANKVFYIPLPPVTLTGGFTISIFDDEANELFSVTSTKGITIGRNKLVIAPALNCASSQTLWSEDFTGYAADAQPSSKGSVNYAYGEAGTKVYTTQLASGGVEGPELLIKSGNGTFTVSNIPTGGATSMTLTFKTNRNLTLSTTTDGISGLDNISSDGNARTVSISNTKEASIFDIEFKNTLSNNARIDDIVVSTVPTSFTAPTISAGDEELTIGVGQSSASTTVSLANAIDGLGISAIVSGEDAENFTAAIDGTTLTVTAESANTTAADKVVTVTLKASGASNKAISVTQTSCLVPNPADLTAIAGDAEVDVTWTGDAHATSYVAYLHTAATATPVTGGTNITSSISNSGTNYKIEDYSSVDNDQTYYLYIKVNGVASGYVAPTDYAVVSFTPAQAKGTAENPYLASEAYDIVSAYASGEGPEGTIYVKGYVSSASNPSSNSQTYFISDDGTTEKQFEVYKGKGISDADITDANKVSVGDWVVVSGTAINYSGTTPEFSANSTIYTHNPKLAAPEFTPAAGTYYSAQSVAISATNSATIYYTTDGTDPDENSDEYEEPIAVSADMTIKAIAVKANFVNSAVASAAYDIEAPTKLSTPVISVDSYNHNSIAFSWAAVDNATGYQVSTDGGSSWLTKQEETSYNWTGLSASTSYTIKVKAIGTDNGQYTDSDVASKSQTTGAALTLSSIAVTTNPTKMAYSIGESFSMTGAVVTATYSDESTANVTTSCSTNFDSPATFTSAGAAVAVTISYTEGGTTKTVDLDVLVSERYEKVTDLKDVTAGEYVIVNDGYFLPNATATNAGPVKSNDTKVTISNSNSVDIVSGVTSDMTWTFTGTAVSAMTIKSTKSTQQTSYYLYVAGTTNNNQLRVNTTSDHTWTIAVNGSAPAYSLKDNSTNRYCATYSAGSDWRSYNSATASNYGDDGKVYLFKKNDGKVDASISYARASDEITYGSSLTPPALNGSTGFTISCESDNTSVATVNASTGAITLVGNVGSATITVSWDEQEVNSTTYRAGSTTYTLTINKATPTITAFSNPTTDVEVGNTVTNTTTISNGLSITYTSSNTSVATVNSSTGEVTGISNGVATISATFAGNANFNAAESKSYSITVSGGGSSALSAPSNVSITAISATGFTATWTNDANATGYSWMLSTSNTAPASTSDASVKAYGSFTSASPSGGASLSSNTWTLTKTGLSSLSGKYYFYVKANGSGSYTDSGNSSAMKGIITLTQSAMGITQTGYNSGTERTCTIESVGFGSVYTMKSGTNIQGQKNNMQLYNKSSLGKIKQIVVTQVTNTNAITLYAGASSKPSSTTISGSRSSYVTTYNFTSDYAFFNLKAGSNGAVYFSSIVIIYTD